MLLTLIGVIVGLIMGLTGAGGALITIPLLMQYQHMTLKDASVYSLLTVFIAAVSNFVFQRKDAQIKVALLLVAAAALGSFISFPFKTKVPDIGIAMIITAVALYSLYGVWFAKKNLTKDAKQEASWWKTLIIGLGLGALTTFTGLGGGVLMLPVLIKIYNLPQKKAVATSLVVVGLSSLASFMIQITKMEHLSIELGFLGLALSVFITSYLLKLFLARISPKTADTIRKYVFTLVVFIALYKIF